MTHNPSAPYKPPEIGASSFNCPHCRAFAKQHWSPLYCSLAIQQFQDQSGYRVARCEHCNGISIWRNKALVYPVVCSAPPANADLPDDLKRDFEEARQIAPISPRGAAALLRLAIQRICEHLGEPGKNINKDIASLVQKGLPVRVQKALDIVRVVGNHAVHPGQIDLKDDVETANKLFGLVNLIADVMITQPKHVNELYESVVPDSQREAIEQRDGG